MGARLGVYIKRQPPVRHAQKATVEEEKAARVARADVRAEVRQCAQQQQPASSCSSGSSSSSGGGVRDSSDVAAAYQGGDMTLRKQRVPEHIRMRTREFAERALFAVELSR
ncbi:unnamed protein product [Lampetra fluviatilis]